MADMLGSRHLGDWCACCNVTPSTRLKRKREDRAWRRDQLADDDYLAHAELAFHAAVDRLAASNAATLDSLALDAQEPGEPME